MRTVVGVLCLALLGGCTPFGIEKPRVTGPDAIELPEVWSSAAVGNQGKISTGWVKTFRDSEMDELIDEALENNHDLQAAAGRLRIAKEGTIIGRAARLPSINASGSGSRTRRSLDDDSLFLLSNNSGGSGRIVSGGGANPYSSNYGLSLNASWEIDLWGRLRDLHHASYEDYVAAQADFRSARLSLAANTAKAYFDLMAAQQQLELAEQTRDSFVRNYRITERNYKAGDETASPLDVQFGRNNVASAERSLTNRRLSRDEAARPLEVLLGRYPAAEIRAGGELPILRDDVPAGLPSELLQRRPDIVAAEAAVRASANRASAAWKNLLPSFRMSGRGSTSTDELNTMLLDPEQIVWNAASSLAQTVFQGGQLTAQARRALEQNKVALESYASVVLRALREVESALAVERSLAEQEEFLATELRQANLAESQAARDYSEGIVNILSVLEAQRRAVSARIAMIALRNQRLQNRIDLHLALGGDFRTEE